MQLVPNKMSAVATAILMSEVVKSNMELSYVFYRGSQVHGFCKSLVVQMNPIKDCRERPGQVLLH